MIRLITILFGSEEKRRGEEKGKEEGKRKGEERVEEKRRGECEEQKGRRER